MDNTEFLDLLDRAVSEQELTILCRQFAVNYAAFPGASKRDRAREFLGYIRRQGRLTGLGEAIVALRPDLATPVARLFAASDTELAWLDGVAGEGAAMESTVTWRWPSSGSEPPVTSAARTTIAPSTPIALAMDPEPPAAPQAATGNPYTPGRKVSDDAMFFGRAAEHAFVREQVAAGASVAIIAARTFGASSLLHHAARHAGEDAVQLPAYIDMKDPAYHTLPGLLNSIWAQWWAIVKPGNVVLVRSLAAFVTAVRKLNAAGFRPLLFLDELEQVTWRPLVFEDGLFDAWLELGREEQLTIALTAHSTPADLLAQGGYRSRFYELFRQLDLGLLDAAAARALLRVPAERAGLTVPEGAADYLVELAGPHPFFLQLAGLYLFEGLAQQSYSRARVTENFQAAAAPYWQEVWDSLSPLAQAHYPLATTKEPDGLAGRQLRILANKGLVVADGTGYRPFSDGFAAWLRRLRAAGEAAAAVTGATPV